MSTVYLYHPFVNYRDDGVMAGDKGHFAQTGLNVTVIDPVGTKPLGIVGDDDLLMVHAHGDVNTPTCLYLCTATGNTPITANTLAQQLSDHGLKKTHESILVISCWGGGNSTVASGTAQGVVPAANVNVEKHMSGECFASVLAKSLGLLSYRSILVGGFPGTFSAISYSLGNKSAFVTSGGTRVVAQIDHIQWFDAQGRNTA